MFRLDQLSYRTLQWLVAACACLHNLEEALTMPMYAPLVRARFSAFAPPALLRITEHLSWFYCGLVLATIAPLIAVRVAVTHPTNRAAAGVVVFVQSIFLVNVAIPHVPAAFLLGGYAPGIITAVAIELPFSVWFLRRSLREGVIGPSGLVVMVGLAVPALLLALGLIYAVART